MQNFPEKTACGSKFHKESMNPKIWVFMLSWFPYDSPQRHGAAEPQPNPKNTSPVRSPDFQRDLQKGWHGHLARDSWPEFAVRTAVFHGQDARATTSARGSFSLTFSLRFPIGAVFTREKRLKETKSQTESLDSEPRKSLSKNKKSCNSGTEDTKDASRLTTWGFSSVRSVLLSSKICEGFANFSGCFWLSV
jgi:hypothetical protein